MLDDRLDHVDERMRLHVDRRLRHASNKRRQCFVRNGRDSAACVINIILFSVNTGLNDINCSLRWTTLGFS